MPFVCLLDGERIDSIGYSANEWQELKENYRSKKLTMICCGADVIPKTSAYGTQFFAHKARIGCAFKDKNSEYMYLVYTIIKSVQEIGWSYQVYHESEPDYISDIMIFNDKVKIYFDIRLSSKDFENWKEDYANHNQVRLNNGNTQFVYLMPKSCGNSLSNYGFREFSDIREKKHPIFTIKFNKDNDEEKFFEVIDILNIEDILKISSKLISIEISDFVKYLLMGKIQNPTRNKSEISISVKYSRICCQSCRNFTSFILGFQIFLNIKNRKIDLFFVDRKKLNVYGYKYRFLKEPLSDKSIASLVGCGEIIDGLNSCSHCGELLGNIYEYECNSHRFIDIDCEKEVGGRIKNEIAGLNNWYFVE